jgi:hypothetical protein
MALVERDQQAIDQLESVLPKEIVLVILLSFSGKIFF